MAKHKYATSPLNISTMPPGVPYIIGNEAAERFSYYGMKSVLTVFMAHYILNQSGVLAPMNPNEAYMYTHYFVFGVYSFPFSARLSLTVGSANIGPSCRFRSLTALGISHLRAWPHPGELQWDNELCSQSDWR